MHTTNTQFQPFDDRDTVISILSSNMLKHQELADFALEAFQSEGLNRLGKLVWDQGRGKFPVDKPENYREAHWRQVKATLQFSRALQPPS